MSEQIFNQEDLLKIYLEVNEQDELKVNHNIEAKERLKLSDDAAVYITDFVLELKGQIYQKIHPTLGKFAKASGALVSLPLNYVVSYKTALNENGGNRILAHQEAVLRCTGEWAIFEGGFAAGATVGGITPHTKIAGGLIGGMGALMAFNEYEIKEGQSLSDIFIGAAIKERQEDINEDGSSAQEPDISSKKQGLDSLYQQFNKEKVPDQTSSSPNQFESDSSTKSSFTTDSSSQSKTTKQEDPSSSESDEDFFKEFKPNGRPTDGDRNPLTSSTLTIDPFNDGNNDYNSISTSYTLNKVQVDVLNKYLEKVSGEDSNLETLLNTIEFFETQDLDNKSIKILFEGILVFFLLIMKIMIEKIILE